MSTPISVHRRRPVQIAALAVGAIFLVVGVLGFIPGVTTDYDTMTFWGPGSMAMLLGVFNVSILHNIVHLLFGLGIPFARRPDTAKKFLVGSGVIYGILTIYGFLVPHDTMANFPPLNIADNWLHLALTIVLLGLGVGLGRNTGPRSVPTA
jgi:hypothetical protein